MDCIRIFYHTFQHKYQLYYYYTLSTECTLLYSAHANVGTQCSISFLIILSIVVCTMSWLYVYQLPLHNSSCDSAKGHSCRYIYIYMYTMCARTRSIPVIHCIPNYMNDSAVYTVVHICIVVLAYHPGDLLKLVYELLYRDDLIVWNGRKGRVNGEVPDIVLQHS